MDLQVLGSINGISAYLKSYGLLAPAVASALFIVQAVFPVFPYVLLAAAGGLLFGFKLGFFLAWSGALAGACLAYWICRLAGSDWVIKTIQHRFSYDIREIDTRLAFWSIIIARVLPVVPTPIINAAAALAGVPFWTFFFSSAIGKLPTALLYTGLGLCLFQ
ncbi:MAG: TVP38/TMEM64 family protein, partial [Syntrophomonas sp.]|nr:TVP38/TMEM64 family protein [Syntrophomonas sp.]